MTVLGILGSPRIGGNSDILLEKALEGASSGGADVKKIVLNELRFAPCQECANVKDDGSCIVNDDMQLVYKEVEKADAIILSSPIFFGSLSAQTKMMIDRYQCYWRAKYILKTVKERPKRKGAFLSVSGGDRKDFFENAKSIVRNFFATIDVKLEKELFCPNLENKGDAGKHADLLEKAFDIGKKLAGG